MAPFPGGTHIQIMVMIRSMIPSSSLFFPFVDGTFERRNAPLSTFRPIARATPDTSFCYFDPFCNGESANTFVKWITATRGSPLLEGGRFRREARICLQIRRNFFLANTTRNNISRKYDSYFSYIIQLIIQIVHNLSIFLHT